jgi:hypothetical protein
MFRATALRALLSLRNLHVPANREKRPDHLQPVGQLRATFQAAMAFGLREEEIRAAVVHVCERRSLGTVEDPLDELTAALARLILARERGLRSPRSRRC